jgi:integrase/recombinase XerC
VQQLAAEEEIPDQMTGLRPPHVPDQPVPVFGGGDLARLERACAGRSFQQRRDAAVIRRVPGDRGAPVGTGGHPLRPG